MADLHLNDPVHRRDPIGLFALLDLHGPKYPGHARSVQERVGWAKAHFEKQVNHPRFRIGFAVHEVEAWFLSNSTGDGSSHSRWNRTSTSTRSYATLSETPCGANLVGLKRMCRRIRLAGRHRTATVLRCREQPGSKQLCYREPCSRAVETAGCAGLCLKEEQVAAYVIDRR